MMELFKNGSTKTRNCVVKASQDITGLQMNLGDVLPPSMDLFSPDKLQPAVFHPAAQGWSLEGDAVWMWSW